MSKDVDGQMTFDGETVSVPPKTHKPVEHGPAKAKHRVFNLKFVPGEGFVRRGSDEHCRSSHHVGRRSHHHRHVYCHRSHDDRRQRYGLLARKEQ